MVFQILAITVVLSNDSNVRNVIQMALKWQFFKKKNCKNRPVAGSFAPRPLSVICRQFLNLCSNCPPLAKSWLWCFNFQLSTAMVALAVVLTQLNDLIIWNSSCYMSYVWRCSCLHSVWGTYTQQIPYSANTILVLTVNLCFRVTCDETSCWWGTIFFTTHACKKFIQKQ